LSRVVASVCLFGSTALAADHGDRHDAAPADTRFRSVFTGEEILSPLALDFRPKPDPGIFAHGSQATIETLRHENIELKALLLRLTKRVESLEWRLREAGTANIRLLSDEVELPELSPSLLRFPIEIERGMQSDAFRQGWGVGPAAGAIIWNR
jgi:hypothetical protein